MTRDLFTNNVCPFWRINLRVPQRSLSGLLIQGKSFIWSPFLFMKLFSLGESDYRETYLFFFIDIMTFQCQIKDFFIYIIYKQILSLKWHWLVVFGRGLQYPPPLSKSVENSNVLTTHLKKKLFAVIHVLSFIFF